MTAPKRPRRTVERIFDTALQLFNEFGEPNVTTTQIAAELAISPGNLYYHFKSKEAIVEPLVDRFAAEINDVLFAPEDGPITLEDLWLQLHLVFEIICRYRFIYRDINDLLSRYRKVRENFRRVVNQKITSTKAIFRGLTLAGEMDANEQEAAALARNVVLIATYWLSFENACDSRRSDGEIGHGVYQVMSAIAPFLVGESRLLLQRLSEDYL